LQVERTRHRHVGHELDGAFEVPAGQYEREVNGPAVGRYVEDDLVAIDSALERRRRLACRRARACQLLAALFQVEGNAVLFRQFASMRDEPRFKQALEQIKPCNSPEYHQFDFWVGSWEVQNPQGQTLGHNDVNRMVGGCIVQENWASSRAPQSGTSFNFYDYRDQKWHQDYYDNSGNMGNYPPLTGEWRDGRMVLLSAPGVRPLSRWTWYELAPGRVRQLAEQSNDGGKTWSTTWDSIYVKK
jgi:hypothetical protein